MRPNLLIAGIINFLVGALWIVSGTIENNFTLAIGAFVIVSGVIFILYSKMPIQQIYEKRNTLLTLSIFLYPLNIVSAIILSVEYDLIKRDYSKYKRINNIQDTAEETQKIKIEKEVRKLDILLKLGVTMITIAGIMIVTTSWESITDVVKLILLIVIGLVFYGLSKFSEIKLKIKNTTIAYWLLSVISLVLATFLVGYSEMLGNWFSFNGEGSNVFMATFSLIIAGFSYLTYRKFSINSFIYTAYVAITLSVLFILKQLGQEPRICVLVIALILLIINILPKSEEKEIKIVKNFSMVVTYILTAYILVELKDILNEVIVGINLIIQLISLIAVAIRQKTETTKVLSALCIIILTTVASAYLLVGLEEVYKLIITRAIFILMTILISIFLIKDSKINATFLAIALALVLASVMYKIHIAVAIFVGIVALGMLIFGVTNKEYKVLYIEGIVFTIVNLVIQLWDLWGELPFWIYLLIGGFVLIGIVTIKELRKPKIIDGEEKEQVEANTTIVVNEKSSAAIDEENK